MFWPAFLASAGLPWPTDLLVHGYLTLDGEKISKSGRTLDPLPLVDRYGADAVRYYLLRHVRTSRDGDFSLERFVQAHDAELANGLGNLASRLRGALARAAGGVIPAPGVELPTDAELRHRAGRLPAEVDAAVARFALDEAVAAIFRLVDEANRYLTREAPWAPRANGGGERGRTVLRSALEALRVIAGELAPFLPGTSEVLRGQLGAADAPEGGWNVLATGARPAGGGPLFARVRR